MFGFTMFALSSWFLYLLYCSRVNFNYSNTFTREFQAFFPLFLKSFSIFSFAHLERKFYLSLVHFVYVQLENFTIKPPLSKGGGPRSGGGILSAITETLYRIPQSPSVTAPFRQGGHIQKGAPKGAPFPYYLISSIPIYLRSASGMVTEPSSF